MAVVSRVKKKHERQNQKEKRSNTSDKNRKKGPQKRKKEKKLVATPSRYSGKFQSEVGGKMLEGE